MGRMTYWDENHQTYMVSSKAVLAIEEAYAGAAITQLGHLEDLMEETQKRQQVLSKELEQLRLENKMKNYHFKEKMAEKLTNNHVLQALEKYHILTYQEEETKK